MREDNLLWFFLGLIAASVFHWGLLIYKNNQIVCKQVSNADISVCAKEDAWRE